MEKWERDREERVKREGKKFHNIEWETGETWGWLEDLCEIGGLPRLSGEGRIPPALGKEVRWAIEHKRKYPEPGKDGESVEGESEENAWVVVERGTGKDLLAFI